MQKCEREVDKEGLACGFGFIQGDCSEWCTWFKGLRHGVRSLKDEKGNEMFSEMRNDKEYGKYSHM